MVRSPDGSSKEYPLTRDVIKVASIKGYMHRSGGGWDYYVDPDNKIAYIRLTNFTAETGDELFHYVRKNKIAESAVLGTMVQALCGEVFPVTKVPKPGSPVCPACQEIYDSMRD